MQLPPHDPPPSVGREPPEDGTRPPRGGPGELPWFHGRIKRILRNPPAFGPRKNEYLPYLVMRSNPGDRGARPLGGVFWESPDIFLTSGVAPDSAPLKPSSLGGVAKVGTPTTLYAHVWNLGRAPVWGAFVEFYWFNPSLGFNYASAHRIGAAMVDLGNRFTTFPEWRELRGPAGDPYLSRGCHAIVRCPKPWVPSFENGGHECLVVRVFEPLTDAVAPTNFDARADRHIGQRNIAVVPAQSPSSVDLTLDLSPPSQPGRTEVEVTLEGPNSMPWLGLYVGPGATPLRPSTAPATAGLLPPSLGGARRVSVGALGADAKAALLRPRDSFDLGCDPVQIGLHASADLQPGDAHVLRVRQRTAGVLVGGYTVVLVKPNA